MYLKVSASQPFCDDYSCNGDETCSSCPGDCGQCPSSNPIAHWKFDETSGIIASDSSWNGNTGTLVNGPVWTAGKIGNSLSFDGTNDYITVANESNFDFERTSSFSVSAWIKTSVSNDRVIISKETAASPYSGWAFYVQPSSVRVHITNTWGSNYISKFGGVDIDNNVWHHVAFTYIGSSLASGVNIYIDGNLSNGAVSSDTLSATILNDQAPQIGAYPSPGGFFSGLIDEVRIYNRALSQEEILSLYNSGLACSQLGGICCSSGQTCSTGFQSSSDCSRCCAGGICQSQEGCSSSSAAWSTSQIQPQNGSFTFQYDAIPLTVDGDALVALSAASGTSYNDFAVLVRFNISGFIDARNGGIYSSGTPLHYAANTQYHFRIPVNVPAKTYSVYVTPQGVQEVLLAQNFSFRSEQSNTTQLSYWGHISETGGQSVCNPVIASQQLHKSDTDKDGCVSSIELSAFIDLWYLDSSNPTIRELIEAIGLWKRGC
ncbi:MAG TPA: LamG domain-containing protein [archaeon]|nr:LamG domain-containing protein [archaeon]